ncbi:MAG: hypothetical protein HC908_09715 [Calothrix sp. SM1_7_51]|nr:hypothetical protein [Calothrix sp. SM1_7_51]
MQSQPLQADGGLKITGGRNVVVKGGVIEHNINYAEKDGCTGMQECPKGQSRAERMRAVYLLSWTGTMHFEGVEIKGSQIWEGFNVSNSKPGAILQVQNVRFSDQLQKPIIFSKEAGDHDGVDVFQTWNGPEQLRIDRMTIQDSKYQTFWLEPRKKEGKIPKKI